MGALLLSDRVLRRAKLDEWEGGVMGARWRGLRLAGFTERGGAVEGGRRGWMVWMLCVWVVGVMEESR